MESINRLILQDLLQRWYSGELSKFEVQVEAESLWEQGVPWPEYDQDDPRSIGIDVLSNLEMLHSQLILREDIPAILTFLETRQGQELEARKELEMYWDTVNFEKRSKKLAVNPEFDTDL